MISNAAICLERFTSLLGHQHKTDESASSEPEMNGFQWMERSMSSSRSCISTPRLSIEMSDRPSLENSPAKAMGDRITVERNCVSTLPKTLLENIVRSFDHLIDTKLNRLSQFLVKRTKETLLQGKERAIHPTLQSLQAATMLVSKDGVPPVTFIYTESNFRTLPLTKGFLKVKMATKIVVLPFVLTVVIFANIFGAKTVQVRITAPGAIVGTFSNLDDRIDQAEVQIDTERLYGSMKRRCDQIVKKAYDVALSLVKSPGQTERSELQASPLQGPTSQSTRAA